MDAVIRAAAATSDVEAVRALFGEYARELGVDLSFQRFDEERAGLPGEYAPPRGGLWLAEADHRPVGCVALRAIDDRTAEMKRLFLRGDARGGGLGRRLALTAMEAAERIGYGRIVLDTLPSMGAAIALYRALGFRDVAPYRDNPVPGALFLERPLRARRGEP